MTWVKLDDQFFRHPKILALTTSARLLYVAGLCYASSQLTDGAIPRSALQLIAIESGAKPADARKLVDVGLWEAVDSGWMIHNYSEHQRSKDDVDRIREQNRERKAKARDRARHADVTEKSQRDMSVSHARSHADVTGLETEAETETDRYLSEGAADESLPPNPDAPRVSMDVKAIVTEYVGWYREKHQAPPPAGYPDRLAKQVLEAQRSCTLDEIRNAVYAIGTLGKRPSTLLDLVSDYRRETVGAA